MPASFSSCGFGACPSPVEPHSTEIKVEASGRRFSGIWRVGSVRWIGPDLSRASCHARGYWTV
jgi:hypothetical protein